MEALFVRSASAAKKSPPAPAKPRCRQGQAARQSEPVSALLKQRAMFNQHEIQAKASSAGNQDKFELEADLVADKIVAASQGGPLLVDPLQGGPRQADEKIGSSPPENSRRSTWPSATSLASAQTTTSPVSAVQAVSRISRVESGCSGPRGVANANSLSLTERLADTSGEERDKTEAESCYQAEFYRGHYDHGVAINKTLRQILRGGSHVPEQAFFEQQFGCDFSTTRIHTDPNAAQFARQIKARAFTYQNHIAFAPGQYRPDTRQGQHLLAHELTHVIQQQAATPLSNSQPLIQRQPEPGGDTEVTEEQLVPAVAGNKHTGLVDRSQPDNATITWSVLPVPAFKNRDHRKVLYAAGALKRGKGRTVDRKGENDPAQRSKWLAEVDQTQIRQQLEDKLKTANAGDLPDRQQAVFEGRNRDGKNQYYYGNLDTLSKTFLIPTWGIPSGGGTGSRGTQKFFHVDHIVELQLSNWPKEDKGNDLNNMELLDGPKNMQSGDIIKNNIIAKIDQFIQATDGDYGATAPDIKENYTLVFEKVSGSGEPSVRREDYWQRSEIEQALHLNSLAAADPTKIGGSGLVRIFSRPDGGVSRTFAWSGNTTEEQPVPSSLAAERYWLKPFVLTHKYFKTDPESEAESKDFGYLRAHVPRGHAVFKEKEPIELPLNRFIGARYGGSLPDTIRNTTKELEVNFFSPVSFEQIDIFGDQGIVASGNIDVSLPFFNQGTTIGIRLENGEIEVFKDFAIEDINLPAPFDVSDCSISVAYNTSYGWQLSGLANFAISGVGQGQVSASINGEEGFAASGYFDFDSELFEPARLTVGYRNSEWSVSGELGIGEGVIPGVNSAQLSVGWQENTLSGSGQIDFSFPWLEDGQLAFSHSREQGFSLSSSVGLTNAVPGLRSAIVAMNISRNAQQVWSLGGAIDAQLDTERIPGLNKTRFSGQIQDGIFDATLDAEFERDIATGRVVLGVTNQMLDADGQVIEGEASDELQFYGSGQVTLQMTPWLQANAGVSFDRTGSVAVSGGIEVTRDLEILSDEQTPDFEVPRNRRPSFDVNIPLASIGVGDVALDLKGNLNAYLKTSPLTLQDVRLNVFYEFDQPDNARVEGNARLHMDAKAGLAGELGLGLSARILVLRGGGVIALTIGAELDGQADLTVEPSWSRKDGFAIDAKLDAVAQPVIFVSMEGYLYAELDALVASVDLWESERLKFFDRRLPLDIRLGARGDIHYQEKPQSELTYSGIEWVVPTADDMQNALVNLVLDEV